jgi:hypothetical protein
MPAFNLKKFFSFIPNLFAHKSKQIRYRSTRHSQLASDKQKKLEDLYRQLLNNKNLVASGRIQFVGLEQIKKKMGKKWSGLSAFVYEITEEIISKHIEKTDLFLGYKDDSYAIIFTKASLDEAKEKTIQIATEIQQRLFTLDEAELKKIEVRNTVKKIKVTSFLEGAFPEMPDNGISEDMLFKAKGMDIASSYSDKTNVMADGYRKKTVANREGISEDLNYMYVPLWEVKRAALTTYICLSSSAHSEKKSFYAYHELYAGKSKAQTTELDLKILQCVAMELAAMEKDGRKLYIACPVHYDTLYNFDSYEIYKTACTKISDQHKSFLIFVVLNPESDLPMKTPYWFISPLKVYCYDIFVEVPIKHDTNFQLLKASGIDTVGVHLSHSQMTEQKAIGFLNSFSSKAKYFKIQKTFALGVSTLSATTSLVCAGFDYIGGSAIHEDVQKPDTVHRYRYEDLLTEMTKSLSVNPTDVI